MPKLRNVVHKPDGPHSDVVHIMLSALILPEISIENAITHVKPSSDASIESHGEKRPCTCTHCDGSHIVGAGGIVNGVVGIM